MFSGSVKIRPIKAEQLDTWSSDFAALGIDGNMSTRAHVKCSKTREMWFRTVFYTKVCFDMVKIYPSHAHSMWLRHRMDETKIFVGSRAKETKVYCGMMDVVEGKENQEVYTIPCNGTCGDCYVFVFPNMIFIHDI